MSSFQEIAKLSGGEMFPLEIMEDLVDALSVFAAKHVGKVAELTLLLKKEQGGRLTDGQKKLLALPWMRQK